MQTFKAELKVNLNDTNYRTGQILDVNIIAIPTYIEDIGFGLKEKFIRWKIC